MTYEFIKFVRSWRVQNWYTDAPIIKNCVFTSAQTQIGRKKVVVSDEEDKIHDIIYVKSLALNSFKAKNKWRCLDTTANSNETPLSFALTIWMPQRCFEGHHWRLVGKVAGEN